MTDVKTIVSKIGRDKLRDFLAVGETAISNAMARKVFPASWYAEIKTLCDDRAIACPISLFNMRQSPKQTDSEAA